MAEFKEKVWIDGVTAKKETDKALLVEIDGDEHWIPKSQIDDDSEVYQEGDEGELVVSLWIAEQKGLG
jgi:hypothetical protein